MKAIALLIVSALGAPLTAQDPLAKAAPLAAEERASGSAKRRSDSPSATSSRRARAGRAAKGSTLSVATSFFWSNLHVPATKPSTSTVAATRRPGRKTLGRWPFATNRSSWRVVIRLS